MTRTKTTKSKTTKTTVPTIGGRVQAARIALLTAMGLIHAANSIGDLTIPRSRVDATALTERALAALIEADEQLYPVLALEDLGGDPASLDVPAPSGDQAIAMGRDYPKAVAQRPPAAMTTC